MKICDHPFHYLNIDVDLNAFPCCQAWCKYFSFGNLISDSAEEVWSGARADAFRATLIDETYSHCDRSICFPVMWSQRGNEELTLSTAPHHVKFSHDRECNYRCIMCRNELCRTSEERLDFLDSLIEPKFIPLMNGAKIADFSGEGDPDFCFVHH